MLLFVRTNRDHKRSFVSVSHSKCLVADCSSGRPVFSQVNKSPCGIYGVNKVKLRQTISWVFRFLLSLWSHPLLIHSYSSKTKALKSCLVTEESVWYLWLNKVKLRKTFSRLFSFLLSLWSHPVIDTFLFIEYRSTKTVFSHGGIRVVFMVEQSETKADIFKSIPLSFVSMKPPRYWYILIHRKPKQ